MRSLMSALIFFLTSMALAKNLLPPVSAAELPQIGPCTTQISMTGVIGPATLDYFERALEKSKEWGCQSILVLINTPGGHLQTTRKIVEEIVNSPRPILCLVHPSGGHAGSAGAIILQACHVSGAMEATNIGAATPILGDGQNMPDDLRKKMINDTRSWLEGLTKLRSRSEKFSQEIVTEAKAVDAKEALRLGAIDVVVVNADDFLKFAQGRSVKMSEGQLSKVQIGTIKILEPQLKHKLLELIADPEIAYLMFMGSLALLYFEITHPGMIVPGVVGVMGLIFSMIALQKLDVWWGGVVLLLIGVIFTILEAFVASFGILGIGGIISFVIGSIFLFDQESSGYSLPLMTVLPVAIGLGSLMLLLAWMAFKTRRIKRRSGYDDLLDAVGKVLVIRENNELEGQIFVKGEIWRFVSEQPLQVGDMAKVIECNNLVLKIKKT